MWLPPEAESTATSGFEDNPTKAGKRATTLPEEWGIVLWSNNHAAPMMEEAWVEEATYMKSPVGWQDPQSNLPQRSPGNTGSKARATAELNLAAARRRRIRATAWRGFWLMVAVVGMTLIYPYRGADNSQEVSDAQALVDDMSAAHYSIVAGDVEVEQFSTPDDGFEGMQSETPGGVPASALIGTTGDNCLLMYWTAPERAQVARLPLDGPCSRDSVASIPPTAHDGYVEGRGPPFDVTALIREEWTPVWFLATAVILATAGLKAGIDLFLIFQRPDQFL